jgi:hypothetical protein
MTYLGSVPGDESTRVSWDINVLFVFTVKSVNIYDVIEGKVFRWRIIEKHSGNLQILCALFLLHRSGA